MIHGLSGVLGPFEMSPFSPLKGLDHPFDGGRDLGDVSATGAGAQTHPAASTIGLASITAGRRRGRIAHIG